MNRRIILNDLKNGIVRRGYLFIPIPILVFYTALAHFKNAVAYGGEGNFISAVIAVLQGIKVIEDPSEFSFISPYFLLLYSWLILITSHYAYDDMREYGIQTFTRCRQKYSWWLSKCIWNMCTVLFYYALIYSACFFAAFISGNLSLEVDEIIWQNMFFAEKEIPLARDFFLYLFVLPFFTSLTLSMMQMFISIAFSPIVGAAVNIFLLLLSISCLSQWLVGNYLMFLRMSIRIERGIYFFPAFLVDLGLTLAAISGGAILLKRKDIF